MERTASNIGAIVLAAGRSSRMGTCKALLPINGRPMIQRVLETLQQAGIRQIVVVTGTDAGNIEAAVAPLAHRCVFNPDHADGGMFSSIRAGVVALQGQCDGLLIALVDHPLVRVATICGMIQALAAGKIVQPVHGGRSGHPVLISADYAPEILALPDSSTLKIWIQKHFGEVIIVETDDAGILVDIDTPEDFHRALNQLPATDGAGGIDHR